MKAKEARAARFDLHYQLTLLKMPRGEIQRNRYVSLWVRIRDRDKGVWMMKLDCRGGWLIL